MPEVGPHTAVMKITGWAMRCVLDVFLIIRCPNLCLSLFPLGILSPGLLTDGRWTITAPCRETIGYTAGAGETGAALRAESKGYLFHSVLSFS